MVSGDDDADPSGHPHRRNAGAEDQIAATDREFARGSSPGGDEPDQCEEFTGRAGIGLHLARLYPSASVVRWSARRLVYPCQMR